MRLANRRHLLPGAAAFAAALLVALLGLNAGADPPARAEQKRERFVDLQLLGMNDLHGRLEPPEPGVGGVAWLGAWLDRTAASHPGRTIRVHAGDMVGASPLISSHFHDEPTIEATNRMELDVGTLGNHEFDEGGAEALRLVRRARYPYIAANTVTRDGGELILPPYEIVERDGVKVGFIGVTTIDTPHFLLSEFARQYRWLDLSDSVNRWVPELQGQGVEAIVVLAHAGGFHNGPNAAAGEIVDETQQMDDAVDAVVAGHTHSRLNLEVDGKLAGSMGVTVENGRITYMGGPRATPPGATIVDGRGKFLMPGIAEFHAHVPSGGQAIHAHRTLTLYALAGVTTARGMLGAPMHLALRDSIAAGQVFGPRLLTSGPSFNGNSVTSPQQAMAMVRAQKEAGYDLLKIHPGVPRVAFDSLAATANRLGIPFAGHVPLEVGLDVAITAKHSTIDHLDGFIEAMYNGSQPLTPQVNGFFGIGIVRQLDQSRFQGIIDRTKTSGVAMVPTQILLENWYGPDDIDVAVVEARLDLHPAVPGAVRMPDRVRHGLGRGKHDLLGDRPRDPVDREPSVERATDARERPGFGIDAEMNALGGNG